MMLAYHIITIGGLLIAVTFLALAVREQVRIARWFRENFDDLDILRYDEPELSVFDQEVADLNDDPLD